MNCRECIWRIEQSHTHHLACRNTQAEVYVSKHGYENGWAFWPWDFDPIWIVKCNNFTTIEVAKQVYEKIEDKETFLNNLKIVGLKIEGINA